MSVTESTEGSKVFQFKMNSAELSGLLFLFPSLKLSESAILQCVLHHRITEQFGTDTGINAGSINKVVLKLDKHCFTKVNGITNSQCNQSMNKNGGQISQ